MDNLKLTPFMPFSRRSCAPTLQDRRRPRGTGSEVVALRLRRAELTVDAARSASGLA